MFAARRDFAPSGGRSAGNVIELTVQVRAGRAGRTATATLDGYEPVTVPFLGHHHQDRAAQHLGDLYDSTTRNFGPPGRAAAEAYGSELFNTLLPEPARRRYQTALDAALDSNGRLRIVLDLDDKTRGLPWEYLFDANQSKFLAMSSDTSVIRRSNTDQATRRAGPIETLRVLVMSTNPRGTGPLDTEAEVKQIREQLAPLKRVALQVVNGQALDDLHVAVRNFAPHVVHLIGHGEWDDRADDGAVLFADEQGNARPVSGRDLGVLLNRPDLRLVLCASCNGARTSDSDPFAGVTESLVAQGVPAAIGMQYPIENRAAALFGTELLAAIARRETIDDALTEARTAVFATHNGIEWATPVVTTRVPVEEILTWSSTADPVR